MSYKGKTPHRYDKGGRSWNEGAFKNWPGGNPDNLHSRQLMRVDRDYLERVRNGDE
jgi:hypothetical protein